MHKEESSEDRRFPTFEVMPLSPAERVRYLFDLAGNGPVVSISQIEQTLPIARTWFTTLDGPEKPYQLYHVYLAALLELVQQGEVVIDWSIGEPVSFKSKFERKVKVMKATAKDGLYLLTVFIVAIIVVFASLKFAAPTWAAQKLAESCQTEVGARYDREAALMLRTDLGAESRAKLTADVESRRRDSMKECEEFYGATGVAFKQNEGSLP